MAAAAILDFRNLKFLTVMVKRVVHSYCITMPIFVEIARTVAEICEFQYYASLPTHAPFGVFLGHIFPQMMSVIVLTPKGPSLG